jgi:hypothetical protein
MFVGFTWPDPELLVTVGVINCIVLAAMGFVAELPLLYVPAVACAALASVIGLHLGQGRFEDERQLSLKVVQASSAIITWNPRSAVSRAAWVTQTSVVNPVTIRESSPIL